MYKKITLLLVSTIFIIAFFLRFNNLSSIPSGLEQDETSIGYNAYSILLTGKDEYGKSFPLSFKAFGEYKLPGYIYASVLPVALFGLNEFSVRFISALSGSLTVVLFYFLLREIFKKTNEFLPITAAGLLAINPWHLHLSRGAFEVTLALFFIVLGVYLWVLAVEKKKNIFFFLSVLSLFASVYTYNIARVFTPLLFVGLLLFYRQQLFSARKKVLAIIIFAVILLIPLGVQTFGTGGISAVKGTLITSSPVVQAPLIEMREYMTGALPSPIVKIIFNLPILTGWHYVNNILSYLSVNYLFISGSTHGNHGIGTSGQFYFLEALFIVIGLIEVIRKKYNWGYFFIVWTILVILVASLTREVPQVTRSFFMVIPMEVLSGFGLLALLRIYRQMKRKNIANTLFAIFVVFFALNLVYYFSSYYIRFPIAYAKDWKQQDKSLSAYISTHQSEYRKIIFDNKAGFEYTSLLFYGKYAPKDFQATVKRAPDDSEGFSQVLSFGKYEFKDIDWTKDYQSGVLIVTTTDGKPNNILPLASFAYPTRPVAFAVKGEVVSYPVQDFAYVIVAKK